MQRKHPSFFFFFNDTATTEIYTLSLHDALPISRKAFEVVLHSDALTQWFVQLQRKGAAQQRLAHQQQGQIAARVHVEVQQQGELFEGGVGQQLGFIADENGVLFLSLIEIGRASGREKG